MYDVQWMYWRLYCTCVNYILMCIKQCPCTSYLWLTFVYYWFARERRSLRTRLTQHIPDVRFVVYNVCRPHKLNKCELLLHQDLHRCMPARSTKVLHPTLTGMSANHILILCSLYNNIHVNLDIILQYHVSDPVHHCKAHSHIEYPSRKVNLLWQVGKQLVIEALYPVCVTTL